MPTTAKPKSVRRRPGAGRPTREQAQARHQELLDEALEQFVEKGFTTTTIDTIAAAVGMTKRTVYSRYPDKKALFTAAVQRSIEGWIGAANDFATLDGEDLADTLAAVARMRMKMANSPAGLRMQRILNAESYRFPEIFALAYDQGTVPAIRFLAELLRRHARAGKIRVENPEIAAVAFLSMVIGAPIRALIWREPADEKIIDERVRICVDLFLNGVRVRADAAPARIARRRTK